MPAQEQVKHLRGVSASVYSSVDSDLNGSNHALQHGHPSSYGALCTAHAQATGRLPHLRGHFSGSPKEPRRNEGRRARLLGAVGNPRHA